MKAPNVNIKNAQFSIGDVIYHKLFDYRGVIIDIDQQFQLSDDWYETVALSKPDKNQPWYHVLVHDAVHSTYVAEQNLEPDNSDEEINHPDLHHFFKHFLNGRYISDQKTN